MRFVNNKRNRTAGTGARLARIADTLQDIYTLHPDITHLVRERGFTMHNSTTQLLFRVVGVFDYITFLNRPDLEVEEISPSEVKKLVTGIGNSSKKDVDKALQKFLTHEIDFINDDYSDSVAVGVASLLKNKHL